MEDPQRAGHCLLAHYSLYSEKNFLGGYMENLTPVLLVTNLAAWEKQYRQYMRTAKRLRAIHGLLVLPFVGALAYLAGVLYPMLRGDIAFGHPSYYEYRAAADTAVLIFAASFVPYCAASIFVRRWVRKAHLSLGFQADGYFTEVREVSTENRIKA
ncbi:hypothetical protein DQ354_19515 [Arthrobacter sp. AQ5-06]|nr:hypothetical protein DQ354_19515 [Arthrobacter sp. AQ5-06]